MHKNTNAFSIVIALGFMILMSSIGLYLLEYMVPFSRNTKGIENASNAYYQSYGGIEDALLYSFSGGVGSEPNDALSGSTDFGYRTYSNATLIPTPGQGDSEIDTDWNQLSQSKPIQLRVGLGRLSSGTNRFRIALRVPDFDNNGSADTLSGAVNDDMILWQLLSDTNSISTRDGNFIRESNIDGSYINLWGSSFGNAQNPDGSNSTFSTFYNLNCLLFYECILKISVINPIVANADNKILPYLEYQVRTSQSIPTQYTEIESTGQSINFRKQLEVTVLQENTNAAFDFAIIQ